MCISLSLTCHLVPRVCVKVCTRCGAACSGPEEGYRPVPNTHKDNCWFSSQKLPDMWVSRLSFLILSLLSLSFFFKAANLCFKLNLKTEK